MWNSSYCILIRLNNFFLIKAFHLSTTRVTSRKWGISPFYALVLFFLNCHRRLHDYSGLSRIQPSFLKRGIIFYCILISLDPFLCLFFSASRCFGLSTTRSSFLKSGILSLVSLPVKCAVLEKKNHQMKIESPFCDRIHQKWRNIKERILTENGCYEFKRFCWNSRKIFIELI